MLSSPTASGRFVLITRVWLALLLLFGSEVVVWANPTGHNPLEWTALALGSFALSTSLLDLAARYRARGTVGVLLLGGLYALAASLWLNPTLTLSDIPLSLVTRVMGAQAFTGALLVGAFFALHSGVRPLPLALTGMAAGALWGVWARWSPPLIVPAQPPTPAATVLVVGAVGAVLLLIAYAAWRRTAAPDSAASAAFRLNSSGWLAVGLVGAALLVWRLSENAVDSLASFIIPSLIALCVLVLYWQTTRRARALLDARTPAPLSTAFVLLAAFLVGGAVGTALSRTGGADDPLSLVSALYAAYGAIWLPALTLALGVRAFLRNIASLPL